MDNTWQYKFGKHTITVKNGKATELYVDDKLQDRKTGISMNAVLTGKLETGEAIKASLGGLLKVECSLFVDNVLQKPYKMH